MSIYLTAGELVFDHLVRMVCVCFPHSKAMYRLSLRN